MLENTPYRMDKKTRYIMLSVAAALVLLAVLWAVFRAPSGALYTVANKINSFGYSFVPDDLLIAYDNANISIAEVMEGVDLEKAVEASRESGFPSDVDKVGGVTLILANDEGNIVTVYLVDGEIELGFIQTADARVAALGKR